MLKQVNGGLAYRTDGDHPDVGVIVWSTGFAGDARHIWVSWLNETPTNREGAFFKQVDGNWYLEWD